MRPIYYIFVTNTIFLTYFYSVSLQVYKTEYLVINSDTRFEVLVNDSTLIEQVDECKYLRALIIREVLGKPEIQKRIEQRRKLIGSLKSIWWDKHISRATKIHIGKALSLIHI